LVATTFSLLFIFPFSFSFTNFFGEHGDKGKAKVNLVGLND